MVGFSFLEGLCPVLCLMGFTLGCKRAAESLFHLFSSIEHPKPVLRSASHWQVSAPLSCKRVQQTDLEEALKD